MSVSLENIESLQEAWTNDESQPQPVLSSPRSLEACRRAGINPNADIKKVSLTSVLMDVLRVRGTPATPQPRNEAGPITPEQQRVLQLYPPSLRNIGSSEEKAIAFEKFQHLEGRRTSAIRMLQEIRKQLIAAEQFKVRKEAVLSSKEPVASRAKTTSAETSSSSPMGSRNSKSPPTGQRQFEDSESVSSVSTATTEHRRPERKATAFERMPPKCTPTPTTTMTKDDPVDRKQTRQKTAVSNYSTRSFSSSVQPAAVDELSDSSATDEEIVHHAMEDGGVDFIHYTTSGPVGKMPPKVSAEQRRKKQKEREFREAVEREKKEKRHQQALTNFERERVLRQRQLYRPIQTPITTEPQPPLIELHGALNSTTSSAINYVANSSDAPGSFNEALKQRSEAMSNRSSVSASRSASWQQGSPVDCDREMSAQKRKQVIEAALAFRTTAAAARADSRESTERPEVSRKMSPRRTFDYSSALDRARYVESRLSLSEEPTPTASVRARKTMEFLEASTSNGTDGAARLYM